jgi:hypothetical protein
MFIMKSIIKGLLAVMVIMTTACQSSNDNTDPSTTQVVTSGTWRVTLFTDSGNDETADFNGYTFTFNSDGTISAVKNTVTQAGTWSANSSSNKLIIDLGPKVDTNKPLGELTDDWVIISKSTTEIRLTDDNVASNEFLTFTRN